MYPTRHEIKVGSLLRYYGDTFRTRGILVFLKENREKETVSFYNINTRKEGWAYWYELIKFSVEEEEEGHWRLTQLEKKRLAKFYSSPLGLTLLL